MKFVQFLAPISTTMKDGPTTTMAHFATTVVTMKHFMISALGLMIVIITIMTTTLHYVVHVALTVGILLCSQTYFTCAWLVLVPMPTCYVPVAATVTWYCVHISCSLDVFSYSTQFSSPKLIDTIILWILRHVFMHQNS